MLPLRHRVVRTLTLAACSLATGCTFYSTATHWNGRLGDDGKPIFVKTSTNVGMNLLIILPVLGNTSIDEMLDVTTREVAKYDSNHVRVIETASENYWHGFPPFTWIFTPVITNVSIEYEPSAAELTEVAKENEKLEKPARERAEGDNQHILPGPRR
jgi:hypothetical protein